MTADRHDLIDAAGLPSGDRHGPVGVAGLPLGDRHGPVGVAGFPLGDRHSSLGQVPDAAAAALGPLLVLTDRTQADGRALRDVVCGARTVILREKDLPRAERAAVAAELRPIVDVLLVASDVTIDADGVHLAADDPFPHPRPRLVGRSCHTPDELAQAAAEGCDYATLSPIFGSPSKPGYGPPLGVEALRGPPLPVYALGGVDEHNVASCRAAGATGVAVMGAVMRSDDPAQLLRRLAP